MELRSYTAHGVHRMQSTRPRLDITNLGLLDDLPSPPAVAMEILRLSRAEDTGIDQLAEVLTHDPAMSSKVIRVANSAAYRRRTDVLTVADAASRLGMRSLWVIALGFSLVRDMPKSGRFAGLDIEDFWRRSLTVAAASRRVARRSLPQQAEEAFVVGLFSHLGRLVLAERAPGLYSEVVAMGDGWPPTALERSHLGFSNLEIGAALLRAWELPELFSEAVDEIEGARTPAGEGIRLSDVVRAAATADIVLADASETQALQSLDTDARRLLGASSSAEDLLDGVEDDLADLFDLFELSAGETTDVAALLGESRSKLVVASVELAQDLDAEAQRSRSFSREVRQLQARVREDPLTRLPNRTAFDEFLQRELELRRRSTPSTALGVLLIDIDRFKLLNDEYGHQAGDDVLRLIAASLSSGCRRGELLARYGGEEFVLVAPWCTVEDLEAAGERLRTGVEQLSIEVSEHVVGVTVSVGGACATDVETIQEANRLIQKADGYLYRAKRRGRNRTEVSPEDVL